MWSKVIGAITGAVEWMGKNKEATNLIGNALMGAGAYYMQKKQQKNEYKQQLDLLNLQDQLKLKYSGVPVVDFDYDEHYSSLVANNDPNLANGGILTELKRRGEEKDKQKKQLGGW